MVAAREVVSPFEVFNSLLGHALLRLPIGDDNIIHVEKDKYTAFGKTAWFIG